MDIEYWVLRLAGLDLQRPVGLVVEDFATQFLPIGSEFGDVAGVVHGDGPAQIHLEAAEIQLLEEGAHQVHLLVVGRLEEGAQHRPNPIPGPPAVGLAGLEGVRLAPRAQADECRLGRVPGQVEARFVGRQVAGIGVRAHAAVHVPSLDRREIGGHRAGGQHRLDHRPRGVLVLPRLDEASALVHQLEGSDDHVGGRVGRPEIAC